MDALVDPEIALKPRPKLALWMFERDLNPEDGARAVGCSPETIRRYCRPFGHPDRRMPHPDRMARIVAWTGGVVQPGDFYEPKAERVAEDVQ